MVLSSGLPAPVSRPTSLAHMLTSTMSATASANSALWRSKEVSSSPRSRPSDPSRSSTSVGGSATLGAIASQMPCVVWCRPDSASISSKLVPNCGGRGFEG